jgi:peptide/nickel transport system substrate-binding protein
MTTNGIDERAYNHLFRLALTGRISRRDLIRRAGAVGISAGMLAPLLAACGDEDVPDATVPAAPGADPTATPAAGTTPATGATEEPEGTEEPEDTPEPETTPADAGTGTRGGIMNVALNSDLTTMDPHLSTAAVDRQIYQLVYDKLVDIDENLNIVPELATEWSISDDGMEYTFTLVEGVTFHDGEPFNAEAVKVNFDRMLNPDTASPRRSEIAQVTEVVADDESTVRLVLSQPFSPLLATLSDRAGMIISPKAIEELGEDLARNPVGTGAFTFVEWMTADHLTVQRYDNWWQEGLPHLDQVVYKPIVDANVKLTALRTGDVDMIDTISARDVESVRNDPNLEMSEIASLGFTYIVFNTQTPPFDNMALRQAVAWTIDREAINQTIFFGTGAPAQTPIPTSSWAYDESVQVYQQDYDMARQKLEEGGMPDGFEFTMLVTNSPDAIQLAEAYQAQISEAGITANLELLEFGTLLDQLNNSNFQAVSLGWSGRPDPDGNIYGYFHSEGGLNRGGYANEEVDRLLEQTRAESEPDVRRDLYTQAMTIVAEEVAMIFVRFPAEIKVWRPIIEGFTHIPDGMMRLDAVSKTGQ